ncbi:MAG: ubiquinol-cytochrome c reductase iron-sulfur subunit, partial [Acidimicrobiales bacterium]
YGADIGFLFAWTTIILGGAGAWSFDAYFAEMRLSELERVGPRVTVGRAAEIDRRTLLRKTAATTLAGGVAVVLAAIVAAIGRMLATGSTSASGAPALGKGGSGGSGGGTTTSNGSSPPATSGGTRSKRPPGRMIGPAKDVPVGGAASFNDPLQQGAPAYALQPKAGDFKAFSAVCTHAGCTVNYAKSAQQFQCPCHGSIYSAVSGAVLQGPSVTPLPEIKIAEGSDGNLYVAD